MKPELLYLCYATALTGILWLPYTLDRLLTRGLVSTVGYDEEAKPQSKWAQRLMKAHNNAVENLVVFATLILLANAMGVSNPMIATASMLYFWARLVHAVTYTLGIPWIRTLGFLSGFVAQAMVAVQLLLH
ncbi:MAPEG family protein [Undibacterium sp. Di26W]|uniref:MAPEG family protein n=1 Tax=Undibacterium sp. Di26W TaxID=3413035 RepID=UPI003BF1BE1C